MAAIIMMTKWFEDGKISEVVHFSKGYYDGEWYKLDKDGKVIKKGYTKTIN